MKRIESVASTLALALLAAGSAWAQGTPYVVEGDGIPKSLTGSAGNAARGRALMIQREAAPCLKCHSIKDKEMRGGGNVGPALDGVGAALTVAQLRLSVVDNGAVRGGTPMPSFHKPGTLAGTDAPLLGAQQIEDLVAYLATLKK